MPGILYARSEHLRILQGYIENIERLVKHVKSWNDWQLASEDLLENAGAAKRLLEGMVL